MSNADISEMIKEIIEEKRAIKQAALPLEE